MRTNALSLAEHRPWQYTPRDWRQQMSGPGLARQKSSSAVRPTRFPHHERMEVALADIGFPNFRDQHGVVAALHGIRDPRFDPRPGIRENGRARERSALE